jgi:hypothetical protein
MAWRELRSLGYIGVVLRGFGWRDVSLDGLACVWMA